MRPSNAAATATDKDNNRGPEADARRLYRFRKSDRLPDSAAFSRVFRGASKSRDEFFTVLSKANGTECARLGLAISKKNCRAATGRNRLKRIVRESFRLHRSELPGIDVVVMGQQGASRADNEALFDSLARHWGRASRAGRG